MSEEEELSGADPFGEEEAADENLITKPMVNKATYLIHKLADRRGADYKEIQKKCKKLLRYENLAKVTLEDGHKIIDKLIELTGGEEEQTAAPQLPKNPDDRFAVKPEKQEAQTVIKETKDDQVTSTMRKSIRAAVDITLKEVVEKEVPVQGLGGFVLEIGKVIFEAKMSEEASG